MNSLNTTPGGLKYLDSWGVLRYAAAEAFIAMRYYELTKNEALKSFAKSQIDYILGSNPINMSYVIGYGSNYPNVLTTGQPTATLTPTVTMQNLPKTFF